MDIKKLANNLLNFTIKRLKEIFGIVICIFGILLFIALISYSPSDPNFIFNENTKIKNILGFQGSYISDLFLQSFGLIAYLIPISYIITGVNIFKRKEVLIFIENTFFIIIYSIVGSIFFSFFSPDAFRLHINGNGGFIGNYFNEIFFKNIIKSYEEIFYYS